MSPMEEFLRKEMQAKGLPMPAQPPTEPEMPRDLSSVSGPDLTNLMNQFSALMAYAGAEAAIAAATWASKKAKYKFQYAKRYAERQHNSERKVPAKTVENELDSDEDLYKIASEVVTAESLKGILDALYEGYSHKHNVLSRELTRRTSSGHQKEF